MWEAEIQSTNGGDALKLTSPTYQRYIKRRSKIMKCSNCGKWITTEEYYYYGGLCSECSKRDRPLPKPE